MQTVIQVVCSTGESLREKIVKDAKLEDYYLRVLKQKSVGRSPGWAKISSNETGVAGVLNLEWHKESMLLIGRVITKAGNKPDELIGCFVEYLLSRHRRRIRIINILVE